MSDIMKKWMNYLTFITLSNYFVLFILLIVSFISVYQTVEMYSKYGLSYVSTTIVGEEIVTQTITIYTYVLTTLFFLGLCLIMFFNTTYLRLIKLYIKSSRNENEKKENA